ncbi:MAG: (E)-4-hydroxy-3-methylbut-2-enyl-diphosphate synthase, partial [Planctomycetota bacterium]
MAPRAPFSSDSWMTPALPPRKTRTIHIRDLALGGEAPLVLQSMAATRTKDIDATVRQVDLIQAAGADLVRVAVDSKSDVEALAEVRRRTTSLLSVDLQENYRLAELVAPHVDKLRYNPGHLHHHEKELPVVEKVRYLVEVCRDNGLAMRIGVNAGSVAPEYKQRFEGDHIQAIVQSAADHCDMVEGEGFLNFCVSIKDSDPRVVVEANTRFAAMRPLVPLHLGVTEAGMPPDGVIKTRIAFEQLLVQGIGDTLRVSLTVPFDDKGQEIVVARQIIDDIEAGRFRSV